MAKFGKLSTSNLSEAHPDLQRLFKEVVKYFDCSVICGHRAKEDQDAAYHSGVSKKKFPNSKHNSTPSMAVDVVPYFSEAPHIRWEDRDTFYYFVGFVKGMAASMGISIRSGADWDSDNDLHDQTFFDAAHFELN